MYGEGGILSNDSYKGIHDSALEELQFLAKKMKRKEPLNDVTREEEIPWEKMTWMQRIGSYVDI
jgi:hypothetical protein